MTTSERRPAPASRWDSMLALSEHADGPGTRSSRWTVAVAVIAAGAVMSGAITIANLLT